jgi:Berberine and berberine like
VLRPGDAGYDAGRRTLDPTFDARPALIVAANRLRTVKRAYDPDDAFRLGAHVAPELAGAHGVERSLRWEA